MLAVTAAFTIQADGVQPSRIFIRPEELDQSF
jgi:hypothetical protein